MSVQRAQPSDFNAVPAGSSPTARRDAWVLSVALAVLVTGLAVVLLWDTVASAVALWWHSSVYNHGFLIAPISAYLVWLKRHEAAAETPSGSLLGVAVTAGFAFVWLVADVADINEGRHIAFVGMLQGILLACLGWRVSVVLAFPILYLWLLVPTGTPLVPLLQSIATSISSAIIGWFGIPIYVEGVYIEVPTGLYHVAPECAGLNFILATLAISPLYVYMVYRSVWKRVIAVVAALGLAVVMNGVRIAGIILLAHWSGHSINIVDDHLLYGWGFFVLVLFAAGAVGLLFADADDDEPAIERAPPRSRQRNAPGWHLTATAGVLASLAVVAVFVYSETVRAEAEAQYSISLQPAPQIGDWQSVPWSADWSPVFAGADLEVRQSYARNGDVVDLYIAYYARQGPGRELVAHGNQIIDRADWNVVRTSRRELDLSTETVPVTRVVAASGSHRRHIAWSYWVDDALTVDPLRAKLLQSKVKLLFGDQRAALIAVSTPETTSQADAERLLESFLEALSPVADLVRDATLAPPAPAPAEQD